MKLSMKVAFKNQSTPMNICDFQRQNDGSVRKSIAIVVLC